MPCWDTNFALHSCFCQYDVVSNTLFSLLLKGDLICYGRWGRNETVPGCSGEDMSISGTSDYCVEPYTNYLTWLGRDVDDTPQHFPLGVCEGMLLLEMNKFISLLILVKANMLLSILF